MADNHKNFAFSNVATAPSPADSGTSLVVTAGHGTKFPTVPFNATVWPAGVQPLTSNAEIVRVTEISTDTFTITRTQESTSARSIIVGDQIANTITALALTDAEAKYAERATQVVAAGTTISVTDNVPITPFSTGSGSNITSTATPFIVAGREGQLVILRNDNGTDAAGLILSDTNYLANSNMRLDNDTLTLAGTSIAAFAYSTILSSWVFLWYKKLKHYDGAINTFTADGSSALTHEWGDGSTTNDTAPDFVATYTGIPTVASVTITVSPDAGYPLSLSSPYTSGTGSVYFRSATRNGTRTFRLSATVNGSALTSDVVVTYRAANYVGISTEATALDSSTAGKNINALTNVTLDTDPYNSYAVNATAGNYIWCAFVDGDALPYFVISSERAGFSLKQNAYSHTTTYGKVQAYDTYRSTLASLGSVTVVTQSTDGQVRNYFGTSTQDTTLTSAQILTLAQSALDTDAYAAWSSIASGASDYLWFAYPTSYTDPYYKETSTGERAGFTVKQTALAHENQYGYTLAAGYDTARSDIVDMPTAAYTTTSTRPATKRYVGKVGQATQLSEAQIEALQLSDLTESPNGTFASITSLGAGDYLWFCVSDTNIAAPTHYGISPGNGSTGYQEASFTAMTVTSVTNIYGYTENYKNIHSNVTGFQAIEINNATTTTWSMKTQAAAFNNRIYMGESTDTDPISNANILALDDTANGESLIASTVAGTYTPTITGSNYLWFCHPDAVADLATIKDDSTGFAIAGSYRTNVSHTNDFGFTETYRCWRSDNVNIFPTGGTVVIT